MYKFVRAELGSSDVYIDKGFYQGHVHPPGLLGVYLDGLSRLVQ